MVKIPISIRLEQTVIDKVKELGIKENRCLSNQIETIIIRTVEKE